MAKVRAPWYHPSSSKQLPFQRPNKPGGVVRFVSSSVGLHDKKKHNSIWGGNYLNSKNSENMSPLPLLPDLPRLNLYLPLETSQCSSVSMVEFLLEPVWLLCIHASTNMYGNIKCWPLRDTVVSNRICLFQNKEDANAVARVLLSQKHKEFKFFDVESQPSSFDNTNILHSGVTYYSIIKTKLRSIALESRTSGCGFVLWQVPENSIIECDLSRMLQFQNQKRTEKILESTP